LVYFVIGFAMFSYLNVPILGIAIFGVCLAYIIVTMENKNKQTVSKEVSIDDDF
jgi:fructoselysine and glucoselysine-specific PTS system IIC component